MIRIFVERRAPGLRSAVRNTRPADEVRANRDWRWRRRRRHSTRRAAFTARNPDVRADSDPVRGRCAVTMSLPDMHSSVTVSPTLIPAPTTASLSPRAGTRAAPPAPTLERRAAPLLKSHALTSLLFPVSPWSRARTSSA
jgi:hypothetical protein